MTTFVNILVFISIILTSIGVVFGLLFSTELGGPSTDGGPNGVIEGVLIIIGLASIAFYGIGLLLVMKSNSILPWVRTVFFGFSYLIPVMIIGFSIYLSIKKLH